MKTNRKIFYFMAFLCFFNRASFATSLSDIYKVGNGARYLMTSKDGTKTKISIYIVDVESSSISIEYFIVGMSQFLPEQLWQRFKLEKKQGMPLEVTKGYILTQFKQFAEEMEPQYLKGQRKGVRISDFLFSTHKEINSYLKNKEEIKVPASKKKIVSKHYQITKNSQQIDFWISTGEGALTLLKLISKGSQSQNYGLELESLIQNVKAKINPKTSIPLSSKMKSILDKSSL